MEKYYTVELSVFAFDTEKEAEQFLDHLTDCLMYMEEFTTDLASSGQVREMVYEVSDG